VRLLLGALACCCCISCDSRSTPKGPDTPPQPASTAPSAAVIAVASLSPAATDLILGMGAADHLVGISNFDIDRPGMPRLPRVGDYQNTDWERLADLHPSLIIVQIDPARIPAGFRDRAAALGAGLLDIQIENLPDIETALDELGTALNETSKSTAAKNRLIARLDSVQKRVSAEPAVSTLISLDERGTSAAGPGTFLDEILTIAGGKNVLAYTAAHWPSIDKERLISLSPQAVIELLPAASTQTLAQAADFWATLPEIPAVANHRTYHITDPWALTPGIEVADLAEHLAKLLHPTTEPSP
jgi:iron complex transport system substrate-binding protein